MKALLSGSFAAILAWFVNRFLVNRWGDPGVALIVPVVEEALKTLMAILLGASIIYAHFTFGVMEAIWDMKVNTKGFQPALFSLLTHSAFGFITAYIYQITGYLILGIILSIITHIIWNSYIIRISDN